MLQSYCPASPNGIMLVGEFPGADDMLDHRLFSGAPGKALDYLLQFAGISREQCYITVVFPTRPPQGSPQHFFTRDKNENPKHSKLGYLHNHYTHHLQRLDEEIEKAAPKIIIALGSLALWALTGEDRISDYRGTVQDYGQAKLIPTHSPHNVHVDWSLRPTVASDFTKARTELTSPTRSRPARVVNIVESPADMAECLQVIRMSGFCAFDVETARQQITCISLAPDPSMSFVIPFWNFDRPGYHQFSEQDEIEIWWYLHKLLTDPAISKLAHNATYDLSYCREHGILTQGRVDDTMLMSHAYQIELPKSLGYLGSIYCNESAWKLMRVGAKKDLNKADE